MAAGIRLEGVERCIAKLTALPRKIQKNAVRKAVRAGGSPFLKAARAKAPARNRLLKSSLTQVLRVYEGTVLAVIGQEKSKKFDKARKKLKHKGGISGRGDLTPIHLVEEDVKPHEITGPREHNAIVQRTKMITVRRSKKGTFTADGSAHAIARKYNQKVSSGRVVKPLAFQVAGNVVYRQRVRHPGHKGAHFVRAAAAEAEKAGLGAFEQKLVAEVLKES